MKKILLIGLIKNHYTLYQGILSSILKISNNIAFLTNNREIELLIKKEIKSENIEYFYSNKKTFGQIIRGNSKLIKRNDAVIIDETYGGFFRLFNIKFKNKKKIMIIHNVNKWFLVKQNIFLFDHFFKNAFFNQFDAYFVLSPLIKKYLKNITTNKQVFFFPFDQYKKINKNLKYSKKSDDNTIDIVIPGIISEKRRNYKELLLTLEKYYISNPNSKIKIIFLGKIENDESKTSILNKINQINSKNRERIKYWNEFVPEQDFSRNLIEGDIILSNINVFVDLRDRIEIYGLSKESGISFQIYKYAKPSIVPSHQNILIGFDNQLIKYSNFNDLYKILENLDSGIYNLEKLKENAKNNRKKFNSVINDEISKILDYLNEK
jgi:hypothetical protein